MPLLQDGQDPDGLAARVAFHLHRHGISSTALAETGMSREAARRIRRGDMDLRDKDIHAMASVLGLQQEDLARPLTDNEAKAWHFYRLSARQVTAVWRSVAHATSAHGITRRQLSKMLDMPESVLSRVVTAERISPVLNWHDASKIAAALGIDEGPDVFLLPGFTIENEPSR